MKRSLWLVYKGNYTRFLTLSNTYWFSEAGEMDSVRTETHACLPRRNQEVWAFLARAGREQRGSSPWTPAIPAELSVLPVSAAPLHDKQNPFHPTKPLLSAKLSCTEPQLFK